MTMENFKELPLEVRLSAYLDGQLETDDAREIETLLAGDSKARELLDTLKIGSDIGNQAFEQMLKEPVPLNLVRAIKETGKPELPRHPANGNSGSLLRYVPRAIAASAVLLLAGGYTGYFIGQKSLPDIPTEISETTTIGAPAADGGKTRGFSFQVSAPREVDLLDVADVHGVYARQDNHIAEMAADEADALKSWLSSSTGIVISIPDLNAEGFAFEGGRLVAVEGKPAGALFYRNDKGEVVGVYYLKGSVPSDKITEGSSEIVSGSKGETAWFVAAPDGTNVKNIAGKVSAAL